MGKDQPDNRLRFAEPLILGVLTIEGEGDDDGSNLAVRLGVFFCSPKGTRVDDYRISLLWHSRTKDLTKASEDFGRLLRATSDFSRWRNEGEVPGKYKYLGPNCCKVVVDQVCTSSAVVVCVHILPNFLTPLSSFATFAGRTANKQGSTPELRHSLSSNAAKVGNIRLLHFGIQGGVDRTEA
jgi:hypothetical protein